MRVIVERDLTCEHGFVGRRHSIMDGARSVAECIPGTEVHQFDVDELSRVKVYEYAGADELLFDDDGDYVLVPIGGDGG